MTIQFFPTLLPGLAFSVKWSPVFFNQSQKTLTGASIDVGLAQYPLHNFELTYAFMRNIAPYPFFGAGGEFKNLLNFLTDMQGSLGRFLFTNPDDTSFLGANLGIGDSVTTTFLILSAFGGTRSWPIGQLRGTPIVYINGTPTLAFTIGGVPGGQTIVFSSAPPAAANLTIDMVYDYYCKLTDDSLVFDKFTSLHWACASVKIQSCRPGA